jgi:hypothetical protein
MAELKTRHGSIILNGTQVDYLIQSDGAGYMDLQVRRSRLTTRAQGYDFTFFLSDGGKGIADCDKKFPGLRVLLAKRFLDMNFSEKSKS